MKVFTFFCVPPTDGHNRSFSMRVPCWKRRTELIAASAAMEAQLWLLLARTSAPPPPRYLSSLPPVGQRRINPLLFCPSLDRRSVSPGTAAPFSLEIPYSLALVRYTS